MTQTEFRMAIDILYRRKQVDNFSPVTYRLLFKGILCTQSTVDKVFLQKSKTTECGRLSSLV